MEVDADFVNENTRPRSTRSKTRGGVVTRDKAEASSGTTSSPSARPTPSPHGETSSDGKLTTSPELEFTFSDEDALLTSPVSHIVGSNTSHSTSGSPAGERTRNGFDVLMRSSARKESPKRKKKPLSDKMAYYKKVAKECDGAQLTLDLGQKDFGNVECAECGMMYMSHDPNEELRHAKYHEAKMRTADEEAAQGSLSKKDGKRFWWEATGAITALIHRYANNSEIVVVEVSLANDRGAKLYTKVADELGLIETKAHPPQRMILQCIGNNIVGFVLFEPISEGFPSTGRYCCSKEAVPVKCCITLVWVAKAHRLKKFGTNLIRAVRKAFNEGPLKKSDLAWACPTDDGNAFILKYIGAGYPVSHV